MDTRVRHRRVTVGNVDTFYREAGPDGAPAVLLPHGYPCSSYEFRNRLPRLADRWRLIAPDYPAAEMRAALAESILEETFREEFLKELVRDFLARVHPHPA